MKFSYPDRSQTERRYLDEDNIPGGKASLVIFSILAIGLLLDSLEPVWGQIAAGIMFWGLFITLYHRMPGPARILLMSGLIVAAVGEVFCSLIWKLYDYRLYNIPHYVPPGHMLVFLLGSSLAPRMPRMISWFVPLLAAPYVLSGYWFGFDRFGIVLYLMFIACLLAENDRRLYSTMFMLCLVLEIYGTFLGNWTWKESVPVWGMSTTSPPLASGAFYCVLDFLMLRLALTYWPVRSVYIQKSFNLSQYIREFTSPGKGYAPEMELVEEEEKDIK